MQPQKNSVTNENYVNFRSFYISPSVRGDKIVDEFLEYGILFARKCHAKYIVGKVFVDNLAMRSLYRNHGFQPAHITMEMRLDE